MRFEEIAPWGPAFACMTGGNGGRTVSNDQVVGPWKQIEAEARRHWTKLTDDDWKLAAGDIEKLAGRIRERYGDARQKVARQLNVLIAQIRENAHTPHQEN